MTSSINPEVHKISLCRQRSEPRPWVTCTKIGEDRTSSSEDMIADRQTHSHTQTDRHAHHNTPLPCRGRSNETPRIGANPPHRDTTVGNACRAGGGVMTMIDCTARQYICSTSSQDKARVHGPRQSGPRQSNSIYHTAIRQFNAPASR